MRTTPVARLALLIAASYPSIAYAQNLTVRDPNASFINVTARRASLAQAKIQVQTPRLQQALATLKSCSASPLPIPPPKFQGIPGRYYSGSHGAINPAEHEAAEPYYKVQQVAAYGANNYLVTGNPAEAACVLRILLPWARGRMLLDYDPKDDRQIWYEATWTTASLALAVSVIRAEPTLNPVERDEVIAWLHQAAEKSLASDPHTDTSHNNHMFFRGMMATAVGIISNDSKLFQSGLAIYSEGIGELNPDGSFPLEMARHELALHYQAFAIEPLVMIAELAMRQGYNIYPLEQNHRSLADAIAFLNRAIADPSLVKKYASEPQTLEFDPGSTLLSWVEFYNARNPSSSWAPFLTKPFFDDRLSGSTTLYAAPINSPPPAAPASAPQTPK